MDSVAIGTRARSNGGGTSSSPTIDARDEFAIQAQASSGLNHYCKTAGESERNKRISFSTLVKTRFQLMMAIVVDAIYVVVWLVANAGIGHVSSILPIAEQDKWIIDTVSLFLAATTLAAIVLITLKDLVILAIRAVGNIRTEVSSWDVPADTEGPEIDSIEDRLRDRNQEELGKQDLGSEADSDEEDRLTHA